MWFPPRPPSPEMPNALAPARQRESILSNGVAFTSGSRNCGVVWIRRRQRGPAYSFLESVCRSVEPAVVARQGIATLTPALKCDAAQAPTQQRMRQHGAR
jgi:hypothetical protein